MAAVAAWAVWVAWAAWTCNPNRPAEADLESPAPAGLFLLRQGRLQPTPATDGTSGRRGKTA